ncbi:Serine/threonine-protein kinase AFC3 [Paramyrothecium foliicola]|nr:Serine/threonine-protein kinase AFC3 [Paramyrothecium foliicola]
MFLQYAKRLWGRIWAWKSSRARRASPISDTRSESSSKTDQNAPSAPRTDSKPFLPDDEISKADIKPPPPAQRGGRLRLDRFPGGLEDLRDYEPDGYHPVHLQDRLGPGNRYLVMNKLGNGGYATIWLCQDMMATHSHKYVALKIIISHQSPENSFEGQLGGLKEAIVSLGDAVCLPLDEFTIDGPNGNHQCFVYPLLGPKVSSGLYNPNGDAEKAIRKICHSFVKALSILHEHGVCHNDLTPSNVLHRTQGLDNLSEAEVIDALGEPDECLIYQEDAEEPGHSNEQVPQYLVYPVEWENVPQQYIADECSIIDFGESFQISNPRAHCGIPMTYRAPELVLENRFGIESDLWALGCTLFEMRTGRKLFEPGHDEDELLRQLSFILGKLPEPWWSTTWKGRESTFPTGEVESDPEDQINEYSTQDPCYDMEVRSLQARLSHGVRYEASSGPSIFVERPISDAEVEIFADLLGRLLQYDPSKRISAAEVLEHEWFKM